jgi:ribosomal protein S18 acetylase RimI-like enzyme
MLRPGLVGPSLGALRGNLVSVETDRFRIEPLDKAQAASNVDRLVELLGRIPKVDHSPEDVLADEKAGQELTAKWDYSLAAWSGQAIVGVLLTHVRLPIAPHYVETTFYLSGLAVDSFFEGQGVGRALIAEWLRSTSESDWVRSGRVVAHSIQTNAAEFNSRVCSLYESFGFEARSRKQYDNRTDVVMFRPVD